MPSTLETPVLTVDANSIHRIDTKNVENLFSIWTVFSRCAGSIEEGRRLENLSWRLWNRETFCCDPNEANATTPAISISRRNSGGRYSTDVPDLSNSLDSIADDEEAVETDNEESASTSAPLNITRPRVVRHDSGSNRSRGRERHITPDDLEKMVITIKEKKDLEPFGISTHSYLAPLAKKPSTDPKSTNGASSITSALQSKPALLISPSNVSPRSSAAASITAPSDTSARSVVRGFSPSQVSSSYRSIPLLNAPSSVPKSALASNTRLQKTKKHAMFALGGSSQSDNDSFQESSMEARIQQSKINQKKSVFQLGGSSGDDSSLRINMKPTYREERRPQQKKQTSFQEEVARRSVLDNDVFETDDEDDVDESAIDDDDSSEWEDSMEESGRSSLDDKLSFPRVDSRPNLTSRRSLITTMLHQGDRATAMQRAASKSTPALHRSRTSTPQGPSMPASVDDSDVEVEAPLTMKHRLRPGHEVPRTGAQPIIQTTTNITPHQAALSPRTTRRQMLAAELTPSLRRNLLWERQQKNQTASAVMKRRHTTHDMANLTQHPEPPHMDNKTLIGGESFNTVFGHNPNEYHSKGW